MLCVTMTMAMPMRFRTSMSSRIMAAWVVTSRADVGSSPKSRAGWNVTAMAMPIRCRMPPDNSWI